MAGLLAGLGHLTIPRLDRMRVLEKRPFEKPYEGDEPTRTARRAIDGDIDKLEVRIRSLRRRRNDLSSISILPPEVLSKVFIFVRDMSSDSYYRNGQAQWIRNVGHICHHWRDVALCCPTLWSVPLFTHPELAQEMVHRSKMAALTVRSTTGSWTPRLLDQIENVMTQISRIQTLHLTFGNQPDRLKTILTVLSQPAPLLESITLTDATYHMYNSQNSLPEDAFNDAPRLRSVELERLNFSWESAIFKHSNVTILRLKNSRVVTNGTSTIGQMMDALNNLHNLRILELNNSIPSHVTSNGNEKTLKFKFLENLTVDTRAADFIPFLRCIRYPSNTILNLRCSSTKPEEYAAVLSLVGQALRPGPSAERGTPRRSMVFRAAELLLGDPGTTRVSLYEKRGSARWGFMGRTRETALIDLHFEGDHTTSCLCDHVVKDVCNSFDLSSLRSLVLDWAFSYHQEHLIRECFGKLPKLNYIRVCRSVSDLLLAIKETPPDGKVIPVEGSKGTRSALSIGRCHDTVPPVTTFPALKTLYIEGAEFRQSRSPESMGNLVDMLMQRSEMNAPIHKLLLEGCAGIRTAQKRLLGEVVVDLEVDGERIEVGELRSGDEDSYDDNSDFTDDEDYEDDSDYPGDPYYDLDIDDAFGWLPF
ncbi:hypothetical protein P691DRAFT_717836 [Macrolepiota fuliginosa MF-IS2]|uniref:F-box domain-containing protein n=1 Tax=Macrolepiota fuliginosa MF-IS2 TaxID=1400762 RepID=A0A9P6CAQ9_9AGAR|nr:hypothetical protein P691DRAFT_717836 [Macrolepiota fuliginosa MF-IS2]